MDELLPLQVSRIGVSTIGTFQVYFGSMGKTTFGNGTQ